MTRPLCETDGCDKPAYYELEALWSAFDWLQVLVCTEHLEAGLRHLYTKRIDGLQFAEIQFRMFE